MSNGSLGSIGSVGIDWELKEKEMGITMKLLVEGPSCL